MRAHLLHTGPEILRQTGGAFDAFCDFAGTGGSFAGCAAAFKEHNPSIGCYVVEPAGAAVLAGEARDQSSHRIQGGGYSMADAPLIDPAHVDGYLTVSDADAVAWARRLAGGGGDLRGLLLRRQRRGGRAAAPGGLPGEDRRCHDVRFGAQVSQHRLVGVSRFAWGACPEWEVSRDGRRTHE